MGALIAVLVLALGGQMSHDYTCSAWERGYRLLGREHCGGPGVSPELYREVHPLSTVAGVSTWRVASPLPDRAIDKAGVLLWAP